MIKQTPTAESNDLLRLSELIDAAEFHAAADELWEQIHGSNLDISIYDPLRAPAAQQNFASDRSRTPNGPVQLIAAVQHLQKTLSMWPSFQLSYGNVLSDSSSEPAASTKIGKSLLMTDVLSEQDLIFAGNWLGAEIRLILTRNTAEPDLINDVSVSVRRENTERQLERALSVCLEDEHGNQQSAFLSEDRLADYMIGVPLRGDIEKFRITACIVDP